MDLVSELLNQMGFLVLLIAIGYALVRFNLIPDTTPTILSKLETYLFVPALVMGTFISNFTIEKLSASKTLLIGSVIFELIVILISHLIICPTVKDRHLRNISLYGLCFANFGYVGNAVVSAIFPDVFLEYIIFTTPLQIAIYIWASPSLLIGGDKKISFKKRFYNFINPMFIGMAIGIIIGLLQIPVPKFVDSLVTSLGNCMSPIAMLLTGMTIAKSKLGEILKSKIIYSITFIRLIVYPVIFVVITYFIDMPKMVEICALCAVAMPLGLNSVVIPGAYGKDTKDASGMALVSHVLSCVTIPLIFMLYTLK